VAGDPVVLADLTKEGDLLLAKLNTEGTTGMKVTSGWQGYRAGGLSF